MEINKHNEVNETHTIEKTVDDSGKKTINGYKFIKELGRGAFSTVYLVTNLKTNRFHAIKKINKTELAKKRKGFTTDENGKMVICNLLQDAMKEIAILKKLNHKNIIRLNEIITDEDAGKIYLVMEYAGKGPVMAFDEETEEFSINEFYTGKEHNKTDFSENDIKDILRDMVSGLDYLHTQGVAHRDIKPDNLMLDDFFHVKITDFNVSSIMLGKDDKFTNTEGTTYFFSPEMCQEHDDDVEEWKGYNAKPADIWALGVTLYVLIFKKLPLTDENNDNMLGLYEIIAEAKIEFPEDKSISSGLKNLLLRMLEKDPSKRITCKEMKEDKWLNEDREDLSLIPVDKIEVTHDEIHKSLNFFGSIKAMTCAKKFGNLLKNRRKASMGHENEIDKGI